MGMDLPSPLTLARFEERLAAHSPGDGLAFPGRRAAVAAVLRFERGAPDLLLMRRAERAGDRWSGQVSLPGGRESPEDPDLLATAIRETREEVGLDLVACGRPLGRLEPVRAVAQGKVLPLTISPFVFVATRPAPLVLGDEAAAAFWLPLERVAAGELCGRYEYRLGPTRLQLPCWEFEGHTVWGLTHRMIEALLALVR